MKFIGQIHIMKQLGFLLPSLYQDTSRGANFLFRGPSGYGKTTMALAVAKYLANGDKFEIYWGDLTEFRFIKRIVFIDEVHKVKDIEYFYPEMDKRYSPDNHIFLFATNHDANLPEAFSNRCFEYIFDEYSDEELLLIARESATFFAPDESFLEVVEAGNRNPRIVKSLIDRMGIYLARNNINPHSVNFKEILSDVFKIENGLDTLARRYLEVLSDVGGTASLSLLRNILHVDEGTLKNSIEPILLRKGLVKITAKGRSLV